MPPYEKGPSNYPFPVEETVFYGADKITKGLSNLDVIESDIVLWKQFDAVLGRSFPETDIVNSRSTLPRILAHPGDNVSDTLTELPPKPVSLPQQFLTSWKFKKDDASCSSYFNERDKLSRETFPETYSQPRRSSTDLKTSLGNFRCYPVQLLVQYRNALTIVDTQSLVQLVDRVAYTTTTTNVRQFAPFRSNSNRVDEIECDWRLLEESHQEERYPIQTSQQTNLIPFFQDASPSELHHSTQHSDVSNHCRSFYIDRPSITNHNKDNNNLENDYVTSLKSFSSDSFDSFHLLNSPTDSIELSTSRESISQESTKDRLTYQEKLFPRYAAVFSPSNLGRLHCDSLSSSGPPILTFGNPNFFAFLKSLPANEFVHLARSVARYRKISRLNSAPSTIVSINLCSCCTPHSAPVSGANFVDLFWTHQLPHGALHGVLDTCLGIMLVELHPELQIVEFLDRRLPAIVRQQVGNRLDRNFVVQIFGISFMRSHLSHRWTVGDLPECTASDMKRLCSHPLYHRMLFDISNRHEVPTFRNLNLCPIQYSNNRPLPFCQRLLSSRLQTSLIDPLLPVQNLSSLVL